MSSDLDQPPGAYRDTVIRKIKMRVLPFLVVLYIMAFIDRANVGYAALEMNADLGITKAQFGLIAGLFSVGYFLFEVPSNMLMRKVGARKWIARILFSWGAVAVATGFVHDFTQLAIARTVLGIAEAGFFPCVLLYLTLWFPERERARVVAQFMIALPVATLIAGPLSGMILDHVHWFGVSSWRWVFILEGIPAVLLGIVTLFVLVDGPHKAKWLTRDEADWLTDTIEAENRAKLAHHGKVSFLRSLAGIRTLSL
ncbi:MFS transporter, partial [Rhodococcus sp. WS4]